MKKIIWDISKVCIIFVACTMLFYFGMRMLHSEYEQLYRYHKPEDPAVEVFKTEDHFMNRLNLFFRLGE